MLQRLCCGLRRLPLATQTRDIAALGLSKVGGQSFSSSSSSSSFRGGKKNSSSKQKVSADPIGDPIVLEYVMEKIASTTDPEKLEKISRILDAIERREEERQKKSVADVNTHPTILTETDVYRAVTTVLETPEEQLIKSFNSLSSGESNEITFDVNVWKRNIKKRIQTIPTFQLLRLLKSVFKLQERGEFEEDEGIDDDLSALKDDDISDELLTDQPKQPSSPPTPPSETTLPAEIKRLCNSIWQSTESEFSRRLKHMSIEEIARTAKLYAHANRSNPSFFREIENEIFERDMEYVNYKTIGVLLEAFSHANLGSTTLYANLAKTIKVAEAEIHPMQLAKYAYYFSKTPENIHGGFGVYQMAERKLDSIIALTEFPDLLKLSQYFFAQNIGSNKFLAKLEESLVKEFPSKQYGGISPNALVKLLKATSKHYFTFSDQALFHMLESEAIKQVPFLTATQASLVLWSYSRSRRGNNELYDILEKSVMKKRKLLNTRTLAFTYYHFALARKGSSRSRSRSRSRSSQFTSSNPFWFVGSLELFSALEERILELEIPSFSGHYLVKILTGMNMRNALESLSSSLLTPIVSAMRARSMECKYSEAIGLLYLLVEIPPYRLQENDQQISLQSASDDLFKTLEEHQFIPNLQRLRIDEASQLYFAYRAANTGSELLLSALESRFSRQTEVPKQYFAKVMYSLVQHGKFDLALPFIPIIKELTKYGDIKFFFSHEDFIKISWSLLLLFSAQQQQISYDASSALSRTFYIDDIHAAMFAINPNTVKFSSLPIWTQAVCMVTNLRLSQHFKKFEKEKKQREIYTQLIEKVDEIDAESKNEYIKRDLQQFGDAFKAEIFNSLHEHIMQHLPEEAKSLAKVETNLVDEFLNVIDCAAYIPTGTPTEREEDGDVTAVDFVKIGVVILNDHHYSNRIVDDAQDGLLLAVQNKIALLQNLLGWQIIVIDEHKWKALTQQQKDTYFADFIEMDDPTITNE